MKVVVQPQAGGGASTSIVDCTTDCDAYGTVAAGVADISVTLYDAPNGGGAPLSAGSTTADIQAASDTVLHLSFGGVAAGALFPGNAHPIIGQPTVLRNIVRVIDADRNIIVGSEPYVNAGGQPTTLYLNDSDGTGRSSLSTTKLTHPTPVNLSLDGRATSGVISIDTPGGSASVPFVTYLAPEVSPPGRYRPYGRIGMGSDGNLWFVAGARAMGRRNADGTFSIFPEPSRGSLDPFASIFPAADGAIWIPTQYALPPQFDRVDTSGQFTSFPLPHTFAGNIYDTVRGTDGSVWFDVQANEGTPSELGHVDLNGHYTFYPTPENYVQLGGLTLGPDNNLWLWEIAQSGIRLLKFSHRAFTQYALPSGALEFFVGADKKLWFPFVNKNTLVKMNTNGQIVSTTSLPPAPAWNFLGNRELVVSAVDGQHNVWFVDRPAGAVGRFTSSGQLEEFPTHPPAGAPTGITAAPDGKVYFCDVVGIGTITPQNW